MRQIPARLQQAHLEERFAEMGPSMILRSIAPQRPSTTRITSPSSSIIYRWRLSLAKGEPRYDALEEKLSRAPVITVPAITIASDFDGVAAEGKSYANKFSGKYSHRILNGIGHNVPQEAPDAFAKAIVEVDGYTT